MKRSVNEEFKDWLIKRTDQFLKELEEEKNIKK